MSEKKQLVPAFTDDRGSITDILAGENIDAVTLISFEPGAARANHYHIKTIQWNYVLEGELIYSSKGPFDAEAKEVTLKKGDFVESGLCVAHALKAVTASQVLILTKGPRSGEDYESDTYRLKGPLL